MSVPHEVLAAGWIPFVVVSVVSVEIHNQINELCSMNGGVL